MGVQPVTAVIDAGTPEWAAAHACAQWWVRRDGRRRWVFAVKLRNGRIQYRHQPATWPRVHPLGELENGHFDAWFLRDDGRRAH